MANFPWYEVVGNDGGLAQGDVLEDVIVLRPVSDIGEVVSELWNLVVMTQSCDIEEKGLSHLTFCPLFTLDEMRATNPAFNQKDTPENLRKGRFTGYYPISKSDHAEVVRPFRIVQFERVVELARPEVERQIASMGSRLRILPPYREDLSQAFARFFMRVGLPVPAEE